MRHLDQRCERINSPRAYLRLDFDARQKVRSRVVATNGEVVGIHIARGTSLRDGDCLRDEDGAVFMVRAAGEPLSFIRSNDALELTRAAYHLGNRHVRLQIETGRLSYQSDHVLDEMLSNLGFSVEQAVLPFEPEPGAYHRHGEAEGTGHSTQSSPSHGHHHHGHGHTHPHDHHHEHAHDHEHDQTSSLHHAPPDQHVPGESHHRIATPK